MAPHSHPHHPHNDFALHFVCGLASLLIQLQSPAKIAAAVGRRQHLMMRDLGVRLVAVIHDGGDDFEPLWLRLLMMLVLRMTAI